MKRIDLLKIYKTKRVQICISPFTQTVYTKQNKEKTQKLKKSCCF